jgi:predicted phosphodiesterase
MALYGVIADIHGNREALGAALGLLERRGAQRLLCLGDVVGYNADPDECVALVRESGALTIAGNHDLIGVGRLDFRRCSAKAEYSLKRTRRTLGRGSAAWLAGLPPHLSPEAGVVLVHGGVRDVQQYMVTPQHIRQNAAWLREDFPDARVCFFGHSHEQRVYEVEGEEVRQLPVDKTVFLHREKTYFVNPGSIDASRKRDHKLAECALFDTGDWSIEFLRLPYDCAAVEAKAATFGYRITPGIERLYKLKAKWGRANWGRTPFRPKQCRAKANWGRTPFSPK